MVRTGNRVNPCPEPLVPSASRKSSVHTEYPMPTSAAVSATMRGNRRRDTAPELKLRSVLHRRGLRFRVQRRITAGSLNVRPDLVFGTARTEVSLTAESVLDSARLERVRFQAVLTRTYRFASYATDVACAGGSRIPRGCSPLSELAERVGGYRGVGGVLGACWLALLSAGFLPE